MNKSFVYIALLVLSFPAYGQKEIILHSPGKNIHVAVSIKDKISYTVTAGNDVLMKDNVLSLQLASSVLGDNALLTKKTITSVNTSVVPVVPLKNATVKNQYNLLRLDFKNDFSLEFRAYDDGIAYRFITAKKDTINILNEEAHLNFSDRTTVTWSEAQQFKNDYQVLYQKKKLDSIGSRYMSILPVIFDNSKYKILVSEADLFNYPCMFLKKVQGNSVDGVFPKVPMVFGEDGDRSVKIENEAGYIARTTGTRNFPWRFFIITNRDEQIIENEMVVKLSPAPQQDFSWVKPGQVTWEWWHDARVYGVDFKSGYNQDTYKYYIDFAANHGIPYILMDEGWAKTTMNPFEPNPTINLQELISYGRAKNVRILLWFTWLAVERNFSVFKTLHEWGIAGMKIDFMDRSDQWMVNYYERVAMEAAKNQLLVDFHGAFKPAGLEIKYPNVLSYEGVVGMEGNIWSGIATPNNNVYLPFLRNAVGPMDYTPGAMISAHPRDFHGNRTNEMSIGTRAHQLSMYVVFESGLQMLADNPYNYLKEKESTDFITSVPVTWDETKSLLAREGEFLVTAKRKGNKWFIGAMTNSTERQLEVSTDFLEAGETYSISIIQDGVNADVQAMDYKKIVRTIKGGDKLAINMVADGGYVASIVKTGTTKKSL
jgi:alpha-glucosidase